MRIGQQNPTGEQGSPDLHARRVADVAAYSGMGVYVRETEGLWRESMYEIEDEEDWIAENEP